MKDIFKENIKIELKKFLLLRYGENPHQKGAFYVDLKSKDNLALFRFKKVQGKELSFNNLLDITATIDALCEIEKRKPACIILKHQNPCCASYGKDIKSAFLSAFKKGDTLAAFGGIIGLNREVGKDLAKEIVKNFFEVLICPKVKKETKEIFSKKPKLIILENENLKNPTKSKEWDFKRVRGGFLVQEPNLKELDVKGLEFVTKKKPTKRQINDLLFAWKICKVSKSNAVVLAKNETLISSGVGQQDRKRACEIAVMKAKEKAKGCVAVSDGFFPFPDGPEILIKGGVRAILQPGGSIRDKKVIELCDKYKIPMVFSRTRAFKH